jgi:hypothetical protein
MGPLIGVLHTTFLDQTYDPRPSAGPPPEVSLYVLLLNLARNLITSARVDVDPMPAGKVSAHVDVSKAVLDRTEREDPVRFPGSRRSSQLGSSSGQQLAQCN